MEGTVRGDVLGDSAMLALYDNHKEAVWQATAKDSRE
jgi:hypothetical protein